MEFDPENPIVQLCGNGMLLEGEGKPEEAAQLFQEAWQKAANAQEKFIAAHYVARHQPDTAAKLKWDTTALDFALQIAGEEIKATYPSLYLNIGKCHEDLGDPQNARKNYQLALSFTPFLAPDGFGDLLKRGIAAGLKRTE